MSTKTIKYEDSCYSTIMVQIDELNVYNRKLLAIAEHIITTSIVQIPAKPPAIIRQIQQDLRAGFNTLIQALRQYFKSIEQKLKHIQTSIQQKHLMSKLISSKQQKKSIETLAQRIQQLQINLKKTQQNQTKLLDIIQKIAEPLQQSTMLSQQKSNNYDSNFNLMNKQQNNDPQLYPRPYSVIESESCQVDFRRDSSSPYCFAYGMNHRVKSIPLHKRSLKGQKEAQQIKKSHKMNYMMKLLKQ